MPSDDGGGRSVLRGDDGRKEKEILVFRLGREEFGLDIGCVREVLKVPEEIHPLSQAPSFIDGVVSLREHIIALIDLNRKFGVPSEKEKSKRRIIICRMRQFIVGLMVDEISEIVRVACDDIEGAQTIVPAQSEDSCVSSVMRLEDRVISLLDLEKFLSHEEAEKLAETRK